MRKCSVCGIDKEVWRFRRQDLYCKKHYFEMYHFGEIKNLNGKRKKNVFIDQESWTEIYYDNGEVGLIDKEDRVHVEKEYWGVNSQGYSHARIEGKLIRLQRYLLNFPDAVVDHKNRNKLDNRKENLRICSQNNNSKNLSVKSNNQSGVAGVSRIKSTGKWRARIMVDRREINLGHFVHFEDAVTARRLGELNYYGEFAPSFPEVPA